MKIDEREDWDNFYMEMAEWVGKKRSRDPSHKVGAVIVRPDTTQVSFGYNDFARGVRHHPERYKDKSFKDIAIVHAEVNAVLNARANVRGCRMFVSLHPCSRCASVLIQSGISEVVIRKQIVPPRWADDMTIARVLLNEGGVKLTEIP